MFHGPVPSFHSLLSAGDWRRFHDSGVPWWRPVDPPVSFLLAIRDNLFAFFPVSAHFDLLLSLHVNQVPPFGKNRPQVVVGLLQNVENYYPSNNILVFHLFYRVAIKVRDTDKPSIKKVLDSSLWKQNFRMVLPVPLAFFGVSKFFVCFLPAVLLGIF